MNQLAIFESENDWVNASQSLSSDEKLRRQSEASINTLAAVPQSFQLSGYCVVCEKSSSFAVHKDALLTSNDNRNDAINWRETLTCSGCKLNNRMRGSVHILNKLIPPSKGAYIYLTERVTPLYDVFRGQHSTQGSEYLAQANHPGQIIGEIQHEDIMNLSFSANTFDYTLSFDVLEHVPDHRLALTEIYRILKPGGKLLLSVPFSASSSKHTILAEQSPGGEITFFREPEYHGNPIDPENGALCYRYFGWSLLDDLQQAGYVGARAVHYWSRGFGNLGRDQFQFIAEKG